MAQYVRCRCGSIYDMWNVEVTGRYTDCSVWVTPCCGMTTDDRPAGWGPPRSYTELSPQQVDDIRHGPTMNMYPDMNGYFEEYRFAPGHAPRGY